MATTQAPQNPGAPAPDDGQQQGTQAQQPAPEAQAPARGERALSRAQKDDLARIRQERAYIVALNAEAWGDAVSATQANAIAEFIRRNRLQPGEVDVLGGRPYRNGYYYRRRVGELRLAGLVKSTKGYFILGSRDRELKQLAESGDEWGTHELVFRQRERIMWSVPEDASHAYVVEIALKGGDVVKGCDYITPGRTKKTKWGEKTADPVGEEEPEKTVITRAWRRAGLLAAHEPGLREFAAEERRLDEEAEVLEGVVEEIQDAEAAVNAAAKIEPRALAASVDPADPYGLGGTTAHDFAGVAKKREQGREAETVVAGVASNVARPMTRAEQAALEDPYERPRRPPPPRVPKRDVTQASTADALEHLPKRGVPPIDAPGAPPVDEAPHPATLQDDPEGDGDLFR